MAKANLQWSLKIAHRHQIDRKAAQFVNHVDDSVQVVLGC